MWERPAIAVSHMATGEKWAKGYDLQLRFWDMPQYPQVSATPAALAAACRMCAGASCSVYDACWHA
jgi:hypothetical protein